MSLKSMMIVVAALSGFAYAGSACCGDGPDMSDKAASKTKSAAVVQAVPAQTEVKASSQTVTLLAKAACDTKDCADKKDCGSCKKSSCDAKAASASTEAVACTKDCCKKS